MRFKEIPLAEIVDVYVDNRGKTCPVVEKENSYKVLIATNCITESLYPEKNKIRYVDKETYENWFRSHPQPNDIIFVNKGTPGGTALVPENIDFCIAQDMVALRIKDDFDFKYVFAALRSDLVKKRIESMHVGTMIPHFKKGDFKLLTLPIPEEIKDQENIGKTHLNILKKIHVNKEIINKLEELAQTLFKRWFVDFEFPNEEGKPYKSSGGKMVESEFGMIPEGWEVKSLSEIANFQNGLAMQKFRPGEGEDSLPVLKIKELRQGFTDYNSDLCSTNIKDSVKVYDGDVIFSWSATLLVKLWVGGNAGLNQHLFKVTSEEHSKWFYYLWTKHYLDLFNAIAQDKATTMGHIKRSHLDESKVIVPSEQHYIYFDSVFNRIIEQKINLLKENKSLIGLRDTLLPKLLSGEIELPDDMGVTDDVPIS